MLFFIKNTDEGCEIYDEDLNIICEACDDSESQIVPSIAASLRISEKDIDTNNMHWVNDLDHAKDILEALRS